MKQAGSNQLIRKTIIGYAFTFSVVELSGTISQLIDGIIVSNALGAETMAAYGLAAPYFYMVSMFSGIIAVGLQAVLSNALGSGDKKKLSDAISTGLWCMLAVAAVVTVLGLTFSSPLCRLLGATGDNARLFPELHGYTVAWFIGVPGYVAYTVLSPLVVLDGNKRCMRVAVIVQAAVNVLGDILAVTFWKNGLFGIAFATSMDFYAALIVLLTNFLRPRSMLRLRLKQFKPKTFFRLVHNGLPILTQRACRVITPMVVNRVILAVGSVAAMTARSVQDNLNDFFMVLGVGIAESLRLTVQVLFSEEDREGLRQAVKSTFLLLLPLVGSFCILIALFAPLFARIYLSAESAAFSLVVKALRIFSIYIFFRSVNECLAAYIHASGNIRFSHFYTVVRELLFIIPCVILLSKKYGTVGLYIAYPVSEALSSFAYILAALGKGLLTAAGKKNARKPDLKAVSDYLLLLPDWNPDQPDMVFSISSMDDVVGLSRRIGPFCKNFGIDDKRSFYVSLCVEELAGNIVEHGFPCGSSQHNCSVRLLVKDGSLMLRFRDDCRYFNLCKRYESLQPDDPLSGIGIRMVYGIAKDVQYTNILNTNTLIITL